MGFSAREKLNRNSRKNRTSNKRDHPHHNPPIADNPPAQLDPNGASAGAVETEAGNCSSSLCSGAAGLGCCAEEQLEELLLNSLEILYSEAISKLVALGYDEELALKSLLQNGHCYGSLDVLTNVLENAIAYINSRGSGIAEEEPGFRDMRQLQLYTLAGMVCLLRQVRPQLSKAEAMWCLLMSDLHLGRASTMEMPPRSLPDCGNDNDGDNGGSHGVCKLQGSCGGFGGAADFAATGSAVDASAIMNFSAPGVNEIECPKRFNLSPKMESLLKRNVAMFVAGFRSNAKPTGQIQAQSNSCSSVSSLDNEGGPSSTSGLSMTLQNEGTKETQNLDIVESVLGSLGNLSIDDKPDGQIDHRDEIILNFMRDIRELEGQLKERREWAHQKALQAAKKLSNDLTELKMLRMEREETLRLKKGKQTLEDSTMKRLSEMENALRKASGQVDLANAAVRRLENENAEMRAELEASKLSASESVTTCLEVAKREKKCLKRLLNWEKQKVKLQEEMIQEKEKRTQLEHQLLQVIEAQKETEMRWKHEVKAKEVAIARVEEEKRAKEGADASVKRNQEALRRKIEIDFQRHKDDIQRLEEELSRLKSSAELSQLTQQTNTLSKRDSDRELLKPTGTRVLNEVHRFQEVTKPEASDDRQCVICMKDEVSVVFLPCAHQVLCAKCNQDHEKAYGTCPCCSVKIDQRILVYGASS